MRGVREKFKNGNIMETIYFVSDALFDARKLNKVIHSEKIAQATILLRAALKLLVEEIDRCEMNSPTDWHPKPGTDKNA